MKVVHNTSGILLGGMTEDGVVLSDFWHWSVEKCDDKFNITFREESQPVMHSASLSNSYARFGASLVSSSIGFLLIGGISARGLIPLDSEVILLSPSICTGLCAVAELSKATELHKVRLTYQGRRALLVGHSVISVDTGEMLVLGGGAVCFSFGTYWNPGLWTLQEATEAPKPSWYLCCPPEANSLPAPLVSSIDSTDQDLIETPTKGNAKSIERVSVASSQAFEAIVTDAKPVILEGLDIGPCTETWTIDYLRDTVGPRRQVRSG